MKGLLLEPRRALLVQVHDIRRALTGITASSRLLPLQHVLSQIVSLLEHIEVRVDRVASLEARIVSQDLQNPGDLRAYLVYCLIVLLLDLVI